MHLSYPCLVVTAHVSLRLPHGAGGPMGSPLLRTHSTEGSTLPRPGGALAFTHMGMQGPSRLHAASASARFSGAETMLPPHGLFSSGSTDPPGWEALGTCSCWSGPLPSVREEPPMVDHGCPAVCGECRCVGGRSYFTKRSCSRCVGPLGGGTARHPQMPHRFHRAEDRDPERPGGRQQVPGRPWWRQTAGGSCSPKGMLGAVTWNGSLETLSATPESVKATLPRGPLRAAHVCGPPAWGWERLQRSKDTESMELLREDGHPVPVLPPAPPTATALLALPAFRVLGQMGP